jgi:type II secretory pathway component PulF
MSNLLLLLPSLLSMVYLMADFHHKWWWYLIFCSIPIIYLCILAHLKNTNELNEEDDTYTF